MHVNQRNTTDVYVHHFLNIVFRGHAIVTYGKELKIFRAGKTRAMVLHQFPILPTNDFIMKEQRQYSGLAT